MAGNEERVVKIMAGNEGNLGENNEIQEDRVRKRGEN